MSKQKKCHTEIFILDEEGNVDLEINPKVILKNHIFRPAVYGKEICIKCGLILTKRDDRD